MKSDESGGENRIVKLGEFFFRHRGITPIPFWLALFLYTIFIRWNIYLSLDISIGLFFIAVGESIRMYSLKYARSITRTRSHKTGGRLIQEGPFRFTRNPIYIGNLFIGSGLTLLSGLPGALPVFICLFLIQYIPIVRFEESVLEQKYGAEYQEYKQNIPRWIGISRLVKNEEQILGEVYNFFKILRSERHTLSGIVVVGSFMLLHNLI